MPPKPGKKRFTATMDAHLHRRIEEWADRQSAGTSFSQAVCRAAAIGIDHLLAEEAPKASLLTHNLRFAADYTGRKLLVSDAGNIVPLKLPPGPAQLVSTRISFTPVGNDPARSMWTQTVMETQLVLAVDMFDPPEWTFQARLRHLSLVDAPDPAPGMTTRFANDAPREVAFKLIHADGLPPQDLGTDPPALAGFIHLVLAFDKGD